MPAHFKGDRWTPGPQLEGTHQNSKQAVPPLRGTPIGKTPLAGTDAYPESAEARRVAWEAYRAKQAAGTLGLRSEPQQPTVPPQRDSATRFNAIREPRLLHLARTVSDDERETALAAAAAQDPEAHAYSLIEHLSRVPSAELSAAHTAIRALTQHLKPEAAVHQQLHETWHETVQGKASLLGPQAVANYLVIE